MGFWVGPGNLPDMEAVCRTSDDKTCITQSRPMPELFTADWQEKLKRELNSRIYSTKTVNSYIYYNKAFCRTMQKGPSDVNVDDIKAYLAYLDKGQDISASSVNLAISVLKFFYGSVLKRYGRAAAPAQGMTSGCLLFFSNQR
jgi:site-specific recombinase XerD